MTPYTAFGAQLGSPVLGMLGELIRPALVADVYRESLDANSTAFNSRFPDTRFGSWFGAVFDTTYVVDTLRVWAECAQCRFGFGTTLVPRPTPKLANGWQTYVLTNGVPSDSLGPLSSNGLRIDSSAVPIGGERVLGVPFGTAAAEGIQSAGSQFTWLDWRTLRVRRLGVTMTPASRSVKKDSAITFTLAAAAAQMPARVQYRYTWNDGTAASAPDTSATARHAFPNTGTFTVVGEILDPRNAQVIERARTTMTVTSGDQQWSSWRITPAAITPGDSVPPADSTNVQLTRALQAYSTLRTWWSAPATGVRTRTLWFVAAASSIDGSTIPAGLYVSDSGQANSSTSRVLVLTPGGQTPVYDDSRLNWSWNFTGAPPDAGVVSGQNVVRWPSAGFSSVDICLFQDEAPYVYLNTTLRMSGQAATGTITYTFRPTRPSCLRPRSVITTWTWSIPFTATRLR